MNAVPPRPCQPQPSSVSTDTTSATISWTSNCYGATAAAVKYSVNCINFSQMQTSTSVRLSDLRPNTPHMCYVYGVDNVGRLGDRAAITFTTRRIRKFMTLLLNERIVYIALILLHDTIQLQRCHYAVI